MTHLQHTHDSPPQYTPDTISTQPLNTLNTHPFTPYRTLPEENQVLPPVQVATMGPLEMALPQRKRDRRGTRDLLEKQDLREIDVLVPRSLHWVSMTRLIRNMPNICYTTITITITDDSHHQCHHQLP